MILMFRPVPTILKNEKSTDNLKMREKIRLEYSRRTFFSEGAKQIPAGIRRSIDRNFQEYQKRTAEAAAKEIGVASVLFKYFPYKRGEQHGRGP